MTIEERVRRLEGAMINLSNILETRLGPYASDLNRVVTSEGAQLYEWIESALAHRAAD